MLRSWRLNYAHEDCHYATADQGIKRPRFHCYRHYLLALKTLLDSHVLRCQPVKSGRQNPSPDLHRRLLSPSLNRRKGHPKLLLAKLLFPKLRQSRPLQSVQIGAFCLPTTKDELLALLLLGWFSASNLASLWFIIASCIIALELFCCPSCSKAGDQLLLNLPDFQLIYREAVSKRNISAVSAQLRHLGRSTIAIVSS